MSDEFDRLRGSLEELASEARRRQGPDHPGLEELIAYRGAELPAAAAETILEHLTFCRECAQLALEIPAFLVPPSAAGRDAAPDPRISASWEALRARLRAEPTSYPVSTRAEIAEAPPADARALSSGAPESRPGASPAAPVRLRPRTPPAARALAACLALGVVGLSLWIATHGRSQEPPRIVQLFPPAQQRGGAPANRETTPVQIRLGAEATGLIFYLPTQEAAAQPYPRFRVEFRGADGRITSPAAAAPVTQQAVLVLLTYHQLAPGDYRARVLGVDSGHAQLIQDYPLRVLAR